MISELGGFSDPIGRDLAAYCRGDPCSIGHNLRSRYCGCSSEFLLPTGEKVRMRGMKRKTTIGRPLTLALSPSGRGNYPEAQKLGRRWGLPLHQQTVGIKIKPLPLAQPFCQAGENALQSTRVRQ